MAGGRTGETLPTRYGRPRRSRRYVRERVEQRAICLRARARVIKVRTPPRRRARLARLVSGVSAASQSMLARS
jgi:hypothetical protein